MKAPLFCPDPAHVLAVILAAGGTLFTVDSAAQVMSQNINLRPGWNAIFLELDLADRKPEIVFTNLVVDSVWTYAQRQTVVEFISDPNEPMADRSQWLRWYPPGRHEARFNTLFAIVPNRPYLIKLPPSADERSYLVVTGQPAQASRTWAANAFTLRGVPADDVFRPTFAEFFQGSPAHYRNGQLQPMFRLGADGHWSQVAPGDRLERSEAFWIYTRGASEFTGAMTLGGNGASGLIFGPGGDSLDLEVHVQGAADRVVGFQCESLPPPPLYLRRAERADATETYVRFPSAYKMTVAPAQPLHLQFQADRGAMETPLFAGVYAIRDGAGSLLHLPVRVER